MKRAFRVASRMRLAEALASEFPWLNAGKIRRLIEGKNVRVGGARVSADVLLDEGDGIDVFLPAAFAPEEISVVYADENVVIADKPAHVDSVTTLPKLLSERYGTLYPVHRLDTNTTGIVVLARGEDAKTELERAFRAHTVRKKYIATVVGVPQPPEGRLRGWLVKDAQKGVVRVSDRPCRGGAEAITDYKVLESGDGLSVLALYPLTGRMHQLRAQLAHMGYPILGDGKYGNFAENRRRGVGTQALRAVSITFLSPGGAVSYLSGKEFEVRQ